MSTVSMDTVIERLFKRLSATYGASWTRQYADVPANDVKTAWMYELEGYAGNLQAIAYALENLPERCPNVIQFRNICRAAPSVQTLQIERPKADPVIVAIILKGLAEKPIAAPVDWLDWARRIMARFNAGDKINPYTLFSARTALRLV